jgi:hypothetical protein
VTFRGFTSTSPLVSRALLYGDVVLRMRVSSRLRSWLFSAFEEEVVLPRGTRWRVAGVRRGVRRDPRMRHPRDPDADYGAVFPARVTLVDLVQTLSDDG